MSTTEVSFREWTDAEQDYVVAILHDVFQKKLLELAGSRNIDEIELNELAYYWDASAINTNSLPERTLLDMSPEEIQKYFLHGKGDWKRGIKYYTQMAETSLTEIIERKLETQSRVKLLDIGCGDAAFLREVQEKYGGIVDCTGIAPFYDTDTKGIDFHLGLAELLPEAWTDHFDLVTCFEASMYFWNQVKAFDEALRVVKSDGNLFYGTGAFKGCTDDIILKEKLQLHDFTYICPEGFPRAGQVFDGVLGKYLSQWLPLHYALDCIEKMVEDSRNMEKNFI